MTKNITDFLHTSLPYVLMKQEDGSYVVLNRKYKPIGFHTHVFVHYEEYLIAHRLHLSKKTIQKVSIDGDPEGGNIYLYGDGTRPTRGKKYMMAYLEKLALLMKLKVD